MKWLTSRGRAVVGARLISGRAAAVFGLLVSVSLAACDSDPTQPQLEQRSIGVVLNSLERTLTIFRTDTEDPAAVTVGLGPDGSPATFAVRRNLAVIPLGVVPAAAIVNLHTASLTATVTLPENSGATGVAFLNDSIAIVANTSRNTATPINVRSGTPGAEIPVGQYPQSAVSVNDTVYVMNANLVDFSPAGPSSISVIAGPVPHVVATIQLSGENVREGVAGPDGRLYVINSGSFGAGNGSLSIVDRGTLMEVQHVTGFGEFPGSIAVTSDRQVLVASFGYGLATWNAVTGQFVRAPDNAVQPAGIPSASGVGIDEEGRVYTLEPECANPARAFRLTPQFVVEREIQLGLCPIGLLFTRVP